MRPGADRKNRESMGDLAAAQFTNVYFTTLSIIQGVALGILIQNSLRSYIEHGAQTIPYSVFGLLTIILISYEYTLFVVMFRRPARLLDTALPLLLGVFESAPSFFLAEKRLRYPSWWLMTAVFGIVGALAYGYSLTASSTHARWKARAVKITRRSLWLDIAFSSIGTILCGTAFILSLTGHPSWTAQTLGFLVPSVAIVFWLLGSTQNFARELYRMDAPKEPEQLTGKPRDIPE